MSELSVIKSTEEALRLLSELKMVRHELKEMQMLENKLTQKLIYEMREHEILVSEDGEELVTYKYTKDVKFFDSKKLLADNEKLYNKYVCLRPGSRRFVIK